MLQRLIEAHWFQHRFAPTPERIDFWLQECRTPDILMELAKLFPAQTANIQSTRPLLGAALQNDLAAIEEGLEQERHAEVLADRAYWEPLREQLNHIRRK